MVHMVNGTQMDSIIYNRNRQFRSGVNMRTGGCYGNSVFSQKTVYVQYEQPKMPTAAKAFYWSMAIKNFADIGMGIANFFMGIFGKNKAAAPVQTPVASQNKQINSEKQGASIKAATTPSSVPQEVKEPEPEENDSKKKSNIPSSADMKRFSGKITVHDDELFKKLGEKSDITGETTFSEETGQNGYPKGIKVGKYNYTLAKVDADGTVWYKSQDGSEQLYRLEKNNDESIGLNQHAQDNGSGIADVSKWSKHVSNEPDKKEVIKKNKQEAVANTQIHSDEEIKSSMQINKNVMGNTWENGSSYSSMTVTYGIPPEEPKTIEIPANKVAEFKGDEAKIKDYALDQIKKGQQKSQKAE